jgi:hypothetical protein
LPPFKRSDYASSSRRQQLRQVTGSPLGDVYADSALFSSGISADKLRRISVKPGTVLEMRISEALKSLVQSGDLGLNPAWCTVFHQKTYPTSIGTRTVTVDIAMELQLPSSQEPDLIWIFECKDSTFPIQIGAVREFASVLEEIGSGRTKGSMITTSTYQAGAIEYARAKGIGLSTVSLTDHPVPLFWRLLGFFVVTAVPDIPNSGYSFVTVTNTENLDLDDSEQSFLLRAWNLLTKNDSTLSKLREARI